MAKKTKEKTNAEPTTLDEFTQVLAADIMAKMETFSRYVGEKMGFPVRAGLLTFLSDVGNGLYKPGVKVAILPLKQEKTGNDKTTTDGESQGDSGTDPVKGPNESRAVTG